MVTFWKYEKQVVRGIHTTGEIWYTIIYRCIEIWRRYQVASGHLGQLCIVVLTLSNLYPVPCPMSRHFLRYQKLLFGSMVYVGLCYVGVRSLKKSRLLKYRKEKFSFVSSTWIIHYYKNVVFFECSRKRVCFRRLTKTVRSIPFILVKVSNRTDYREAMGR